MTSERMRPDADAELEVNTDLDPVCEIHVEADEAQERGLVIEYEGRTYLFCGEACRGRFEQEPTRYAAAGRAAP